MYIFILITASLASIPIEQLNGTERWLCLLVPRSQLLSTKRPNTIEYLEGFKTSGCANCRSQQINPSKVNLSSNPFCDRNCHVYKD